MLDSTAGGDNIEYELDEAGNKRCFTYSEVLDILKAQHAENMDAYTAQMIQLKQGSVMSQVMLQKTQVAAAAAIESTKVLMSAEDFTEPAAKTLATMYPIPLLIWAAENLGKEPSTTEMERITSGMRTVGALLKSHLKAPVTADDTYFNILAACYLSKRNAIMHLNRDQVKDLGLKSTAKDLKYQFVHENGMPMQDELEWIYDRDRWCVVSKTHVTPQSGPTRFSPFVALIRGPGGANKTQDCKYVGQELARLLNMEYVEVNRLDLTNTSFVTSLQNSARRPTVYVTSDIVQCPDYQPFYDYMRAEDIVINTANDYDLGISPCYWWDHLANGRSGRIVASDIPRYISHIPGMTWLPFIGKKLELNAIGYQCGR